MLIIYRITQAEGWNDDMCVSSMDWRGSRDVQRLREAAHLERTHNPVQAVVPVPSILSKEEGTVAAKRTSSINAARDNVV